MPWALEEDQIALSKQIVRIALRIGATDVAEQYVIRYVYHGLRILFGMHVEALSYAC
jgi:hypothetical protein